MKRNIGSRIILKYLRKYSAPILVTVFLMVVVGFLSTMIFVSIVPIVTLILDPNQQTQTNFEGGFSFNLNDLGPFLIHYVTDNLNIHSSTYILLIFVIALLSLAVIKGVLFIAGEYIGLKVRMNIEKDLRDDAFEHISEADISFFYDSKIGDITSRLIQNVLNAASSINGLITTTTANFVQLFIFGYILFSSSLKLGSIVILVLIFSFIAANYIGVYVRKYITISLKMLSDLTNGIQEFLSSIKVVKAFSAEKYELKHFKILTKEYSKSSVRHGLSKRVNEPVSEIIYLFGIGVIIFYGSFLVLNGELTSQSFILFLILMVYTTIPIHSLGNSILELKSFTGSFDALERIFELEPEPNKGTIMKNSFDNAIELQNVYFKYPNTEKYALTDVTLTIRKGSTGAIVGASGAGKTTLVDIILSLIRPQKGIIKIDGIDRNEIELHSYRRLFSVVPQETLLFNDTVYNNIIYDFVGNIDKATEEKVINAAKISNIHEFIVSLSNGYNTIVGEKGIKLSGGQRQRIAIARALFRDPEIIIFDEATSSLDSESERLIQDSLDKIRGEKTLIIIAHRLSTVMNADNIIVFKDGEIVETGNHQLLLEKGEVYSHLCKIQGILR